MGLFRKIRVLWRLAESDEKVDHLERRMHEIVHDVEEFSAQISALQAKYLEIRDAAELTFRDVQGKLADARRTVEELREGLSTVESAAGKKVQEISDAAMAFVADVQQQVETCRAEAGRLAPEIRRLEDAVQELNG